MKVNESILVIDDDRDFLDIVKQILQKKGYDIETVPSAGLAKTRLQERFFNAVILDISLPDAKGTEFLTSIIQINPDIIAIMLTGHSSIQNAVESINRGAFAYLEKPLDPDNLIAVLNRGLEKQRLVLENRQLMDELERHNRITNVLLSVSQAVSQSLDLQQIIDAALERVSQSTGLEVGFIYLLENDKLVLKGYRGLSHKLALSMCKDVPRDSGVTGRIFTESKPVVIEELPKCNEPDLRFLLSGGYQSFAGVPLATVMSENIGVMEVATSFSHCFSPANVDLLGRIGREIAIAVRNAQMYEAASSAKSLRELDSMRTEFLANVSHELRTPLAVIKGSANSLLQPDVVFDEQTRKEFLTSIDRDADTLTRLVDDLLVMSRLEANALEIKKNPQLMSEVFDFIKDRLESLTVNHKLHVNLPGNIPQVEMDEGRISEVLTNLVENAVKFSEEGTNITIDVNANDKEMTVSVSDEGVGIPLELHDKIFERFFQGEGCKNGRRKGTGLGLAICRGIVEAHGGTIRVDSNPGRGSKFSFNLPLR
jgi:K+-sensing histidine kinase KdpD